VRSDNIRGGSKPVSVQELKALARKHWEEWLPERVRELRAEGKLDEAHPRRSAANGVNSRAAVVGSDGDEASD
jgi:hypothetical protein